MFNVKEYKRSLYLKNKDKYLAQSKENYQLKKEEISVRRKLQRQNDTEEQKQKRAAYMKNYRVKYAKTAREKSSTVEYRYEYYYKKNAPKRGYEFKLTFEDFKKMFEGKCTYCGVKQCHGVDRVDNRIGYLKENSVGCCGMCNRMKWNLDNTTFVQHAKAIANFNT